MLTLIDEKKTKEIVVTPSTSRQTITAPQGTAYKTIIVNSSAQQGLTPADLVHGNIDITTNAQVNVTNYATAQVVDANLIPENIKSGVTILGVTGTYKPD